MRATSVLTVVMVGCAPFSPGTAPHTADTFEARTEGTLRIATWNIETVGEPGSEQYDAALAILDRIRPDIIGLNEVRGPNDAERARLLAADAGFDFVHITEGSVFGSDRNAVFSRLPLEESETFFPADLGSDPDAWDITRTFGRTTAQTPWGPLDLVSLHFKSGHENGDEFRRVVESHRAIEALRAGVPTIVMGDLNDDIRDPPDFPRVFTELPEDLPQRFELGTDLADRLSAEGLPNDAFSPLITAGLQFPEIRQRSGTDATRPISYRRLDYLAHTDALVPVNTETYDCADEARPEGMAFFGAPLERELCAIAADHLPVVADMAMPTSTGLVISEVFADPTACSDAEGEWVELYNPTAFVVDPGTLTLEDASGRRVALLGNPIPPHGYGVFGRTVGACDTPTTGTYGSSLSLNNGGEALTLWLGDRVLDRIEFDAVVPGTSAVPAGCFVDPTPGEPNPPC